MSLIIKYCTSSKVTITSRNVKKKITNLKKCTVVRKLNFVIFYVLIVENDLKVEEVVINVASTSFYLGLIEELSQNCTKYRGQLTGEVCLMYAESYSVVRSMLAVRENHNIAQKSFLASRLFYFQIFSMFNKCKKFENKTGPQPSHPHSPHLADIL